MYTISGIHQNNKTEAFLQCSFVPNKGTDCEETTLWCVWWWRREMVKPGPVVFNPFLMARKSSTAVICSEMEPWVSLSGCLIGQLYIYRRAPRYSKDVSSIPPYLRHSRTILLSLNIYPANTTPKQTTPTGRLIRCDSVGARTFPVGFSALMSCCCGGAKVLLFVVFCALFPEFDPRAACRANRS